MKTDIRKLLGTDKLVIGTGRVLKLLRKGQLKQVLLASNCAQDVQADVQHYAAQAGAEVVQLDVPNEELGVFCKKPFNIMVLGIKA